MRHLPPVLRPQLDALLVTHPFTGSCFKALVVKDPQTSSPAVFLETQLIDHFKLHLPFAGYTLVWEIRFDSTCPEFAPDFLFDDESFLSFLDVDILSEQVPSLANWNVERPECLREVVQQLMNLYTMYQMKRLERDDSSLGDDCSKCMQEFELEPSQLQVLSGDSQVSPYFLGSSTRPPHNTVSVMFLNLERQVSCSQIPEQYQQMALQFLFREFGTTVMCHVNPALRHILGDQEELEVSNFSKSDGLSKYFHHFLRNIQETFSQVQRSSLKRENFHLSIYHKLSNFEEVTVTPIEIGIPEFALSSFLVEASNYSVTVVVQTPINGFGDPKVSVRTLTGCHTDISVGPTWDSGKAIQEIVATLFELRDKSSVNYFRSEF